MHEQHKLRHTMNKNPIKEAIDKVHLSLSSLTLTSTQGMDLRLNIEALRPIKISTEAPSVDLVAKAELIEFKAIM